MNEVVVRAVDANFCPRVSIIIHLPWTFCSSLIIQESLKQLREKMSRPLLWKFKKKQDVAKIYVGDKGHYIS